MRLNHTLKLILILCCLISFFSGCAKDESGRYENKAFGIKLRYPKGWSVKEFYQDTLATFMSPNQGSDDFFIENANIAVQDFDTPITLTEYSKNVIGAIKQMGSLPGAYLNIDSEDEITISGIPARKAVYTITQYGYPQEAIDAGVVPEVDTEGQSFKIMQVWVIKEDRSYIFTYLATKETYTDFVQDIQKMLESIRFF